MKLKLLLGILFVVGVAAALAVAAPTRADSGGTTTTVGTTTTTGDRHKGKKDDDNDGDQKRGDKPTCRKVELKGSNGSGSVALTVGKANHGGSSLVGKQVTLTIPAGATLKANACIDAAGALTLRELHVDLKHVTVPTTATATTGTTTTHS
jgi:hypothetical protein